MTLALQWALLRRAPTQLFLKYKRIVCPSWPPCLKVIAWHNKSPVHLLSGSFCDWWTHNHSWMVPSDAHEYNQLLQQHLETQQSLNIAINHRLLGSIVWEPNVLLGEGFYCILRCWHRPADGWLRDPSPVPDLLLKGHSGQNPSVASTWTCTGKAFDRLVSLFKRASKLFRKSIRTCLGSQKPLISQASLSMRRSLWSLKMHSLLTRILFLQNKQVCHRQYVISVKASV